MSDVNAQKNTLHHPKQRIEWTESQTEKERFEYLMVDLSGQVTVDLKMAKGVALQKI